MSQDAYDDLITRIHMHCQQTAQRAPRHGPADILERWALMQSPLRTNFCEAVWVDQGMNAVGWYVYERRSFIALKQEAQGQVTFAFPPATEQQIKETELLLGFPLPPLLRQLYTQIANGGFGPGYGIVGVMNGYPGIDHLPGDIARRYQWEIDFATALRQLEKDGWASLTPEGRKVLWEDGLRSQELWEAGELTDDVSEEETDILEEKNLTAPWSTQLLPLCSHGCNITTYLFADTEQVVQGMHDPYLVVATSLDEWLERWLAGENLQLM